MNRSCGVLKLSKRFVIEREERRGQKIKRKREKERTEKRNK